MKTCPDCGCRVYSLGCVNCNELAYIARQSLEDHDWSPMRRFCGLCSDSGDGDVLATVTINGDRYCATHAKDHDNREPKNEADIPQRNTRNG